MPVEKRANEWSILRTVFDIDECAHLEESERPVFLLTKNGDGAVPFGVEVPELFRNQADARAVRHPDYLDTLFRGAPHMHKDDMVALPLAFMKITDPDGSPTERAGNPRAAHFRGGSPAGHRSSYPREELPRRADDPPADGVSADG